MAVALFTNVKRERKPARQMTAGDGMWNTAYNATVRCRALAARHRVVGAELQWRVQLYSWRREGDCFYPWAESMLTVLRASVSCRWGSRRLLGIGRRGR
jgi:hypothetical protein